MSQIRRTRRTRRRLVVPVSLGVVGLATLAACGGDDASAKVEIPHVFDLAHDPTSAIPDVDPAARVDLMPADLLRSRLEKELTWHGITLVQVMRAAHEGDGSLDAWVSELTTNTDDLTAAIGVVFGRDEAFAFNQQWAQHTQFLVDYAVAIANGDDDGAAEARAKLEAYATDSGSFFATATDGGLPADSVRGLLSTHIDHMLSMIDAIDHGDTTAALDASLDDNTYLATIAQGLASAFSATDDDAFPGSIDTPEAVYCSLVTTETGNYLLRELFDPAGDANARVAFETATGATFDEVLGVIDQLQSEDPTLVTQTADLALERAFEHARPSGG
ncbi:MAG: hypothetical protein U0Q03_10675 [Acidimicrobiales bacterium]